MFIVLTSAQASEVRGPTSPGASLQPVEIVGGMFVLPASVLNDDAHEMHHVFLSTLPQSETVDWLNVGAVE